MLNNSQLDQTVQTLENPKRSLEELAFLCSSLNGLEDIKKYLKLLNELEKNQLCRALTVWNFDKNETVIQKDQVSEDLCVLLKGAVEAYKVINDGTLMQVSKIKQGKALGEREFIQSSPQGFTYITSKVSVFVVISKSNFDRILKHYIQQELNTKVRFLENFLPGIKDYSRLRKEKIAISMNTETVKRGEIVVKEGSVIENLLVILEGDCTVTKEIPEKLPLVIAKLGPGNTYGEDCVLLGKKTDYDLRVASDHVTLGILKKVDVYSTFPEEVLEILKQNQKLKQARREKLVKYSSKRTKTPKLYNPVDRKFPSATPDVRKKIARIIKLKGIPLPGSINRPSSRSKNFKGTLETLRDCNPNRLIREKYTKLSTEKTPLHFRSNSFKRSFDKSF